MITTQVLQVLARVAGVAGERDKAADFLPSGARARALEGRSPMVANLGAEDSDLVGLEETDQEALTWYRAFSAECSALAQIDLVQANAK